MNTIIKKNKKKTKNTVEKFLENPEQKKIFEEEHQEFLLSELIIALMKEDHVSVRKLAEAAGVSPTVIQAIRSGAKNNLTLSTFAAIAQALGYTASLTLRKKGEKQKTVPLRSSKKSNHIHI